MSEAYCLWHDKELVNVTEWQQEQCSKEGMKCENCQFLTIKDDAEKERYESEVVKKGYDGTDDVCEWREDGYRRWHTQYNVLADNSPLEYKYCPYCGKKIRMTENIGTWQKAIMSKGKMIGADGIDFIPIMWDGREESIFRSYTLEELKHPQPLPKSDRKYWKMKDGKKVYIS